MLVRLGKLAIDVDIVTGRNLDPMLYRDAFDAWTGAPVGSPVELRAALVLIGLCSKELFAATVGLAAAAGYVVPTLGGSLFGVIENAGGDPRDARAAVHAVYAERKARAQGQASATPERPTATPQPRPAAPSAPQENVDRETPDEEKCRVEWAPPKVPVVAPPHGDTAPTASAPEMSGESKLRGRTKKAG